MTTPIEPGAMARVVRTTPDVYSTEESGTYYEKGFEFEVQEFVPVLDEWRGNPDYVQVDFYEGNANGGWGNVHIAAADVVVAQTALQMQERKGPTLAELTEYLSDHLDSTDRFDVNGSDRDVNDGTVEFTGKMDNGLEFAFTVKISDFGVVEL